MNRLQKKCLIASMALHALLCLILLVGPAFLSSKQQFSDLPVLEVIPDKLKDLPFSGGGNPNVKPPPAAPQAQAVQLPPPVQTRPPEPVPKQAEVRSKPPPETQKEPKPEPDAVSIDKKRERPKPQIKVENKIVTRSPNKPTEKTATKSEEEDAKVQARAAAEARRRTAQQILASISDSSQRISQNLSTGTTIEQPGPGGAAYANYAQVVKTIYDRAWIDPEDVADSDSTVQVKVVIARDGRVISDSILKRSGIPALDKSVQNALDRVQQLTPFPEASKDAQRTFIINFNLKAKRLLG